MAPRSPAVAAAGLLLLPAAAALAQAPRAAPAPTGPPRVTAFSFAPRPLHPGHPGAFTFLVSRAGGASITLERLTSGGHRTVGRLRFAVDAGPARRAFDGRLAGRPLPAGRYRATLRVVNARAGASVPVHTTLRVTSRA